MVELHLAAPPEVVNVGVGIHGVRSLRDVFRLPDLWQLHLYAYSADLKVAGTTYSVAPGYVSLTPAGTQVQFDYRGRSEHLYAHFRPVMTGEPSYVPVVQDAGDAAPVLSGLLRSAVEASPSGSARMTAEVWTALWRIVDLHAVTTEGDSRHPAVATRHRLYRGQPGAAPHHPHARPPGRRLPQPPDAPLPDRDRPNGHRLHPGSPDGPRPSPTRRVDPLHPRRRGLGRHPRPPGLQQDLPSRARRLTPRDPQCGGRRTFDWLACSACLS